MLNRDQKEKTQRLLDRFFDGRDGCCFGSPIPERYRDSGGKNERIASNLPTKTRKKKPAAMQAKKR